MAVVEHDGRVMASELRIVVVDGPPTATRDALRFLERLESRWSRFRPDSDISRINTRGGALTVDAATITLLDTMLAATRSTAGRYDPTRLPDLLAAGGWGPDPRAAHATDVGWCHDLERMLIDRNRRVVHVPAGLTLDPGGIGKGLAADLAVAELLARGAAGALVSIGGDLALAGRGPSTEGWAVDIEAPDPEAAALVRVVLDGGGVATSSTVSRTWTVGDERRHHLIDPRTGEVSDTDLATVTVIAPTAWQAEAHATAGLLAGSAEVVAHLTGHGLEGIAVGLDGTSYRTPALTTEEAA